MTIIHIVPGSGGGFYCQNCLRDVSLAQALQKAGHSVLFVPLYLPFMDMASAPSVSQSPVFYGAINVYLEQKVPFYRRLPASFRRLFDTPALLRWAAGKAGTTQAAGLGDLTLSVLEGRHGRQRRELEQLIAWLKKHPPPDIIHLSNALLLGLAPALREAFDAPVVCTLQDEDVWLDALPPVYREPCWERVRRLTRAVDLLVPVSAYYAGKVNAMLDLPPGRCRTIPIGVDLEAFPPAPEPPPAPAIGFLAELTPAFGLHVLIDAFLRLKQRADMAALRLRVTGADPASPTPYLRHQQQRIAAAGLNGTVDFCNAYRQPQRSLFLQSLSVLSVPALRPEAFGLFQLEAMASAVPVAQPRLGAYPEVVSMAGGGVIYERQTPEGLADALLPLLTDPMLARQYGLTGRKGVESHFTASRMAADLTSAYQDLSGRKHGLDRSTT